MARPSVVITYLVLALILFGLLMVGNASVVDAARDFADKWYYLRLQAGWAVLGVSGFLILSHYPYSKLARLAPILLFGTLALLLAVLIPGIGQKFLGARRWLNLGLFSFQPAELAKLTLAIYFAGLLKKPPPFGRL